MVGSGQPADTTQFVYDEDGRLIGEYDALGNLVAEHLWLEDTPVAVLKPAGQGYAGTPAGAVEVLYVWADHLDTPRRITNAANQVIWRWDSDPFGNGAAQEDSSGIGRDLKYHLRFPGQYLDVETGLHYNYFRDYDPRSGRYVQSDPIGLRGGPNPFLYSDASPIDGTDPEGLCNRRLQALGLCGKPKPNAKPKDYQPPSGGGVYIIRDCHRNVVYVGKASNFAARTAAHLRSPAGQIRAFSTPCCPATVAYISIPSAQKRDYRERQLIAFVHVPGSGVRRSVRIGA